ncbi:hypothetical protein FHS15_005774 [Paenibacillus castaneae]|uniref:CPCC family cysteine-rich protein n=1 Tax=Paenibacillus castaneae TaxID=474957 RepID=UPI000C99FFCB|nr:CPCC family cysteine-rich protein [Paenibacillus castaneae]NIK80583.1 hypothetical protein [Paenibacillus castaneae]
MNRLQCPCCGFYTIESENEVIVDICDVCFWQYDVIAQERPNKNIGANHIPLNQARENYKLYGVCKKEFRDLVRAPLEEELPENNMV